MNRFAARAVVISVATSLAGCGFAAKAVVGSMTGGATGTGGAGGLGGAAGASSPGGGPGQGGAGGLAGSGGSAGRTGYGGFGNLPDGGSNSNNTEINCGQQSQVAMMVPPDILIVQDRSGSMANDDNDQPCVDAGTRPDAGRDAGPILIPPFGGTGMSDCGPNSKWSQVTDALTQVIGQTETTVNWGLKFFASGTTGGTCTVNDTAEVPVGPGNATAIMTAVSNAVPGSYTPTRAAITNAVTYLQTLTDANPKFILLATDGEPNCPATGTNQMTDDSAAAEQAVAAALTAGFPTFVVGIGNTGGDTTLNALAVAGGRPQMMPPAASSYYQVNNTADLVSALKTIVGAVASCTFKLGDPPNSMTNNDYINVLGDGTVIKKDTTDTDGWDYTAGGNTQIQFYGPTCASIMSGAIKNVTVTYTCVVN